MAAVHGPSPASCPPRQRPETSSSGQQHHRPSGTAAPRLHPPGEGPWSRGAGGSWGAGGSRGAAGSRPHAEAAAAISVFPAASRSRASSRKGKVGARRARTRQLPAAPLPQRSVPQLGARAGWGSHGGFPRHPAPTSTSRSRAPPGSPLGRKQRLCSLFGLAFFGGVAMTTVLVTSSCYLSLLLWVASFSFLNEQLPAPRLTWGLCCPPQGTVSPCPAPGELPAGRVAGKDACTQSGMLSFWHFLASASLQPCPFLKKNTTMCVCVCVRVCVGHLPGWEKSKQAENSEVTLCRALPAPGGHQKAGNILPATATAFLPLRGAAHEEGWEAPALPRGLLRASQSHTWRGWESNRHFPS